MARQGRNFKRPLGQRRYKKLFVLATEGVKTEPQYFNFFNNDKTVIHVKCLKGNSDSAPIHVLKRMQKYLKEFSLKKSDEAWLVVDKDRWTDEQLTQLHTWSQEQENRGFALTNPKFEYWLLLHFEDGNGISNSRQCSDRLKQHLPGYDKNIDFNKIKDGIQDAVTRARQKDNPPCADWPRSTGTTVYKLVIALSQRN